MVAADQLSGGCSFVHFRTGRLKPARGNLDRSTCAVHVLLRAPRGTPKSGSGSGSPVPAGALAQLPHVLSVCCDPAPEGGLKRIQRDWNGFRIRLAFRAFPVKDAAPLSFLNQPGKRFDSRRLHHFLPCFLAFFDFGPAMCCQCAVDLPPGAAVQKRYRIPRDLR